MYDMCIYIYIYHIIYIYIFIVNVGVHRYIYIYICMVNHLDPPNLVPAHVVPRISTPLQPETPARLFAWHVSVAGASSW